MSINSQYRDIVKKLRERRMYLGLSQEAVAEKVGCGENTIWTWENFYTAPNLLYLVAWASALDFEVNVGGAA